MAMENSYALVVGITKYQHVTPLPPVSDVNTIKTSLIDPAQCAYDESCVERLSDSHATLDALRTKLEWLALKTNDDSTVFIYFSGHGGRIEEGDCQGEYLLTVESSAENDETLADTSMSGDEFSDRLRNISARKILVVFDCCHAGGIASSKAIKESALKSGMSESWYTSLSTGKGRVVFASCRSDEFSYILNGDDLSLFTKHLIGGLRGGARSENGLISVFDLYDYLQPKVTVDHSQQHPIFRGELEENFPIALFLGGKESAIAKDQEGFEYDAYVSYCDAFPDSDWVWNELVPRLQEAKLRVAVSGDVETPGAARVSQTEEAIRRSKRTVLVLSDVYLADYFTQFHNVLAQQMGIEEGTYRLLPVQFSEVNDLPARLSQLVTLKMDHQSEKRIHREWERLITSLKGPLPTR